MDAMTRLCRARYEEFGAAGQASKIKPVPLAVMARRYASGDLDPKFGVSRDAAE
jgi:fructose-bisphosphate aldolase class II